LRRFELTDEQYALVETYLPRNEGAGRRWEEHRRILNGLLWKLSTGASWRDIPERYGPWETIYGRHVTWRRDGTWKRILQALQVKLDAAGEIDWEQWNVDGTSIRASRAAGGARKKGAPMAAANRMTTP
jgi:transposase